MKTRLRWTETELRTQEKDADVVWQLACMIVHNALLKSASMIVVKKTAANKLVVIYALEGSDVEEMTPPAKLHDVLVGQLMRLCGPPHLPANTRGPAEVGARGELEILLDDGSLVVARALVGKNDLGLTITIRFLSPPRFLN